MIFNRLLQDKNLAHKLEVHSGEIISYLLEHGYEFGIVVNKESINFDPPLPAEIDETIVAVTYLMVAGYSLESAVFNGQFLSFEAGFGNENFGSVVTVEGSRVIQIIVDELSIFVNLYAGQKQENTPTILPEEEEGNQERSRHIFLSNPENKKFF